MNPTITHWHLVGVDISGDCFFFLSIIIDRYYILTTPIMTGREKYALINTHYI